MAGTQRYLRYIVFAFACLVLIFFISSSSSVGQGSLKSPKEILKEQSANWRGSHQDEAHDSEKPTQDAPAKASATAGTTPNTHALPPATAPGERMNATFVTLARNGDVWEIARSIRQVEDRFNRKFNYDWVFLNDAEFDDTFKKVTTSLVSGKTKYGKISTDHWSFPSWIDQEKAAKVRQEMKEKKIIYGDSVSYRHMCRYESGFFFRHPLMLDYEWYWRVEPSIELFCDIEYDTFKFMAENKKKYSFVLSLYEYVETIPTLWDATKSFIEKFPQHIAQSNSMAFLSDDEGKTYNHCHFWSNFEIGNLNWLRSDAYIDFFNHLDQAGGFFYERWGDAPVHSIAAGLMLKKDEIHFFNDIAYYHVPFTHCPTGEKTRLDNKCHCNPKDNFDWNGYSCTARYFEINNMQKPEGYEKEHS
ncbi:alpha 1,2-mannosyltransferase [Coniosporium apollinis CBS 100218]|uniref:Alpha 1,2-mannosyltransferase n=1 Tax=Coniosporium apollinis (strain CBS 100218) TaxID=1168221 RepID=R7YG38_CONA1|nr:alpha 1,2-mannosyltransferase [Coniosporium apollinis CBS 100218]EON60877.1 alpha 1,2-mannosyltransferase [Coniosporium apollinis CBS 100218]